MALLTEVVNDGGVPKPVSAERVHCVGDSVVLICPIPCDDLVPLDRGIIVHVHPGGLAFEVRFSSGRIATVTKTEITPH